ncbi:indoleamine 2,3-dioxygenase [Paragonimus westermani]|uniref:Indoleamine 2,3-dioxygenase n=1 Tax=Paragonimus westermani TaxID=34504 RepID=A0A5J4NBK7_9TREM|nr:indoleamine 2,3-dioxygenase [Paragonimus westermani]
MNILENYRLSERTGAILENPLSKLPPEYDPWNRLIDDLPNLFQNMTIRERIKQLPMLEHNSLNSHEELRLAHKLLAFAASAYVWLHGQGGEPESLPAQVAVPLVNTSYRLGLQPIITHQDLVLGNCLYVSPERPPKVIHPPTQHASWEPFIELGGFIEISFAPCLKLIVDAVDAQDPLDVDRIIFCLRKIAEVIPTMTQGLKMLYDSMSPQEFYVELRPILSGWTAGKFKDGILYEGVTVEQEGPRGVENDTENSQFQNLVTGKRGTKFTCIGGSAAQSITLQALDTFLQIKHHAEDAAFFQTMCSYMITEHRKFLQDLSQHSRIGDLAHSTDHSAFKLAYNSCIQAVRKFRLTHLSLIRRFILEPASARMAKIKSLETAGTGGQKLMEFLQRVSDATAREQIE